MISWDRPPTGWVCLNTDGSVVLAQKSTAAGGVLRGCDGRFIKAFAANLGGGSITHAELGGIVHGLRMAWEEGSRKVILQTDSTTAINLLKDADCHNPHYTLIAAIRELLARDWEIELVHVFREGNYVADYLASIGHSLPIGVHLIDIPSPTLRHWLYFDTIGVQTQRIIRN
ncbi:unnamed protein product [Linum tenue]|uniref:RNase H type-1 domain-containing protein n=1 Tax=Linum tenue TaxID=586396 RepID=A0AAV0P9T6_9ROSI|nr:unnamed protein product [Linum tenue]